MSIEEENFTDPKMLRKKAEELLKSRQKKDINPVNESDVKKILHELQVHEVELEMQNEELRKAYETAEEALKKYTMLFDLAPMGYFILDSDGSINDLNFTGAELLDDQRISLVNSNFKLFISNESQKVFNDFFRNVYASTVKESCKVKLGYDGKPLSFVYIEGIVMEDGSKCLLSVVDISKIKQQANS